MESIPQTYAGKAIFVTGCTGFVGKVLLEKLLFSLPLVRRVYVLIRGKRGSSLEERFMKEILDTPCFDRLRARHADFAQFISDKVTPIAGDLLKDGLALSPEDRAELESNVNFIMHSAASVDFNQRLDNSLQINTFGSLRILELAKNCRSLEAYVQISTAYVNCDKRGWVDERLYPYPRDPEAALEELMRIPVKDIEQRTPEILGKFPNTYTFTKCLTEHLLVKLKDNVPLVILRPTIIGGAWLEPFPGWVDSVSAAGAFYLSVGLGLMKYSIGNPSNIGDQIPVDYVSNAVIVAAARFVNCPEVVVIHCGTSALNPVTWGQCADVIVNFWNKSSLEKRFSRSKFTMTKSKRTYNALRLITRKIPSSIYLKYAQLTRNAGTMKQAMSLKKLLDREELIATTFSHFTMNEWIYSCNILPQLSKSMSKEDRSTFELDVTKVNWRIFLMNYSYGLQKFVLKENVERPADPKSWDLNLDSRRHRYFADIMWAYNTGEPMNPRSRSEMRTLILSSAKVQQTIAQLVSKAIEAPGNRRTEEQCLEEYSAQANEIATKMFSDFSMKSIRGFAWILKKVWRSTYDKIEIDQKALKKIAKLKASATGPIIIAPTHRSYIDFLIVSYIFFSFNLNVPFIAAGEDFLKISLIHRILRNSGAFFIRRRLGSDQLYQVILTEYLQKLLKDNNSVEFFIEGTRSRTGKTLHPKTGLLSMCTELYFQGEVPDVHIVPVTINYERVLEGETFPFELLGEEKTKESLGRILKAVKILRMNFGKIHVAIDTPISLKEYTSRSNLDPFNRPEERVALNSSLGYELVYRFQEKLVIMPTALVAAVMLMQRRGVSEDELVHKVEWLRDKIKARGVRVGGLEGGSALGAVKTAMSHLIDMVVHKKDLFEPSYSLNSNYKSILLLSYYRNTLVHIFIFEAYIAVALYSFGEKASYAQGVSIRRVKEEAYFLYTMLEREFVSRERFEDIDAVDRVIRFMVANGTLSLNGDSVKFTGGSELFVSFLCSLIWPLIECYWVSLVFSSAVSPHKALSFERAVQSVQWFAESMYTERLLNFYESCSQESIKNALNKLVNIQILTKTLDQQIHISLDCVNDEGRILGTADRLNHFRKASFVKTINSVEELRRALLSEVTPKL
jgi:glycerone phosphate O-acyltransferase/fatty acyl-CoA reductase